MQVDATDKIGELLYGEIKRDSTLWAPLIDFAVTIVVEAIAVCLRDLVAADVAVIAIQVAGCPSTYLLITSAHSSLHIAINRRQIIVSHSITVIVQPVADFRAGRYGLLAQKGAIKTHVVAVSAYSRQASITDLTASTLVDLTVAVVVYTITDF
jgi:hypothetical protein